MSFQLLTYNIRKQVCTQAGFPTDVSPCSACCFILETGSKPFGGGENIVFALEDHNGSAICMRIQRESTQSASYSLQNEIDLRATIGNLRITGFQKVIGHAVKGNDLIQAPFIMLEWARGMTLRWTDAFPAALYDRNKVIRGIAKITIDLLKVQKHGVSAKEYVRTRIARKIERATHHEYRGGDVDGCNKQFSLIESYWIPRLDDAPHILDHGDLSGNNIIVDESFNVTSVIDLGWAEMVPLQFAAVFPRFLTHEPVLNQFDWQRKDTSMMKRDRQIYLDCIKELTYSQDCVAKDYYEVLARSDECRRYWWFRAISEADIHKAMCASSWDPARENLSEQ